MKKLRIVLVVLFLVIFLNKIHAQGTWSNLGSGINGPGVFALCTDTVNNVLYVGGTFDSAGSIKQNSLAKWDGTKWDTTVSLHTGTSVYALIMYKGNLIIGFSDGSVGEYNGSTFQYLPGFNESVYCFYIYNDTLYAGGKFTHSGSTTLNCIAKWNGTKWLPVDNGFSWIDCCPDVEALTVYNGDLIAAGTFDNAGNIAATSIAAYDGNKWKSLGVKLIDYTTVAYNGALAVFNNKLYVSGNFDSINSVYSTCNIASWNGTNWDTAFSNTYDFPAEIPTNIVMTTFQGYLFISGYYDNQSPFKYDGNTVSTVDSGVYAGSGIFAMTAMKGSLYVGGEFNWTTEARPHTPCIARWTPDSTTGIKQLVKDNEGVSVYPNPTSNQLTFNSSTPIEKLQIKDVLGQTVLQNSFTPQPPKGGALHIDVNALPQGIYFYRVTDSNSQVVTGKFVKD